MRREGDPHDATHGRNLGGCAVGHEWAEHGALCVPSYTLVQPLAFGGGAMISDIDQDNLRACMPEVLALRCGVGDVRRSFRCPSPDHDDRDPSAHFYANDNTVHCFGCGKTWDVFSLVGELDGIEGFPERARAVADMVGYHLDGNPCKGGYVSRRFAGPRPPFDEPRVAGGDDCGDACSAAWDALFEAGNEVARRYLRWRGLDDLDTMNWGLGFTRAPKSIMPQFRVWEPEALGFITIPFWNHDCSEARYCMLRTISRGQVRNKEWRPAGIATPLWMEWKLSASMDVLYVAEGLIDAMAIAKITGGVVMALGGVSNAKRLAQVLYRVPSHLRPRTIVVCMDEDEEGRKACANICRDLDALKVPHAVMPPYPNGAKDADEWLMAGRDAEWRYETWMSGDLELFRTRWL